MDYLRPTFSIYELKLAVGFGFLLFVGIGCLILIIKSSLRAYDAYLRKNINHDEQVIFDFIRSGNKQINRQLTVNSALRDFIAEIAHTVVGEEKTKLMVLYTHLGFTVKDYRSLRAMRLEPKMLALSRCRKLGIPLPDEAWDWLLKVRDPYLKWAALEYLIEIKREKSLPFLFQYLFTTKNLNRGIGLHLLACLAKKRPETVAFLLDHVEEESLLVLILRTLAIYPHPGAEASIASHIKDSAPRELLIATAKALAAHESELSLKILVQLSTHNDWVVRTIIAKALAAYPVPESLAALKELSVDFSYPVRDNAVTSLLKLSTISAEIVQEIREQSFHPSHLILVQLQEVKGAA
jgi:HEAT repeat protein